MTDRRLPRAAAGFAALIALTGGLVLAGSLAASANDGLEFTAPTDGEMITWTSAGFTFTGTTVTGGDPSVTVYEGDGETQVCIAPVVAGAWSCTSPDPLPIGAQSFIAFQGVPTAVPPSVTDTVSVTVTPGAPTYDQPNPYVLVQDATASFSGQTSAPDADIQVVIDGITPTCSQDDIAVPGPWSCSIPLAGVAPGDYTMRVRQTVGGLVSEASGPLQIAPAAALELVNPSDGQTYGWEAGTFAAIDGRAPIAGSAVDVLVDGAPLPACTDLPVDGSGQWSCGNVALAIGGHTITVQQTVAESLESDSALVDVLVPAPDVGGLPLSGEQDTLYSVGGTFGLDGYVVTAELYEGEAELTSCTAVPVSGNWSCDLDLTGLAPSPYYSLNVFQRPSPENPAIHSGAPGAYFFEVTAPVMRITSPANGAVIEWTAAGIPISGTTPDPGIPVSVWYDGETFVCSDPAPTTTWSCPAASFVPEAGSYVLTAEQAGQPVSTVAIDVTLPAPDVNQTGYSYPAGTAFATFSGDQTYPGADVLVELGDGVTRDCGATATAAGWSCQIPIDDVAPDTYNVFFSQHTELESSDGFTLTLEITAVEPLTPVLNCVFTPAGFAVSSPHQMSGFGIYPATTAGGSTGSLAALPGSCDGDPGTTFPSDETFAFGSPIALCSPTCSTTGLAPGLYDVYYTVSDGDTGSAGYSLEPHDYFFTIPEAPAIGSASMSGSTVQLTGTGTPGDTVRVERTEGGQLCTAAVTGSGSWSCSFPASTASSARAVDIDAQSGGMSAYSAARSIPVAVPPVTPVAPVPTPLPTLTPAGWTVEITGDLMNLAPGDTFGVTLGGLPLGWSAEVVMHSTPRTLGTAVATGEPVTMELTVPDDIESGAHRLEVIAVTAIGTRYYENFDAHVTGGVEPAAPDEPAEEPAEESPEGGSGGSGGAGGSGDRSDPGAPSALSASIAPLGRIAANPVAIAVAGGLALALLFLVALPTELLNSSLSSNTSRLGRAYGAIDAGMSRAQDWLIRVTHSRAVAAGLVVLLVAIVYGFVDPGFGFDIVSVRLVLSLAIAFFLLSFGASWISGLIIRRAWGASGVVAIQPSIILFAVVGVVVARILDFSPGFLVGVAIGLELVRASRRVSARAVLVQFLVVVGLALAAWVAYSLFTPGDDFAGMLVEDTLVAVTAEGLTGALIAVFPLQFLDGRELWTESKRLWVAAFLLVAVPFALLVLPTAIEGTEVGDYGVWLLVFAVFGAVSIAIWLVFARAAKREEAAEAERLDA